MGDIDQMVIPTSQPKNLDPIIAGIRPEVPSYKQSGVVKANEPVYPIRNKSMKLLDGSWFTRIDYADGLSTIIPYAPIRSDSGQEQAVYYLSRVLQGPKKNYSPIEKMCLSLYFAATKLRHYFLSTTVLVIARTDQVYADQTRVEGENWEVDPRAIRVHFVGTFL
ncbi:hypothetical protein OROGR_033189 [Orobanche gracilis]